MNDKKNLILMILFVILFLGGGIVCTEIEIARKREAQYIDSWDITENQYIVLTYAKPTK